MSRYGESMATNRHRTSRYWATILTVATVGAVLTVITARETYDLEQEALKANFLSLAEYRAESCAQAIRKRSEVLGSIRSLYDSSDDVSRDEFGLFVEPCLARLEGIRWLAWIPAVSASQRQQHELAARREGIEKFQIVEKDGQGRLVRASDRAHYLPLYFIEPHTDNSDLMGFDLATHETTAAVLRQACDTGRIHTAILPANAQAPGAAPCMSIFAPVYDRAGIAFTAKGRRENLKGYVHGVFDLSVVLEEALQMLKRVDIHVCLHCETAGRRQPLQGHGVISELAQPNGAPAH
jgi:CHASE1-domain containing sensor protein